MRATASSFTDPEASMPDAGIDALIGAVIDRRYAIEARAGEGGMGIVYRARHVHLGATVAIKVLRASLSGAADAVERLRREAQAASAIGDRHIVDVRDFGRLPDGRAYFVMEHLEGPALDDVIDDGALPWRRAVHIAEQVARALAAAHDAGIVHRDLKPENVMLIERQGDPDFVKVLDFGVAKIERAAMKITAAGTLLGTPHYMAPEQCRGAPGIDHRADVYALGVMLYEMIVGVPPFDAEDLGTLLKLQALEEPFPPSQVCELPRALEALILRCLAKHPDDRFQTMREVREALRAVAEDVEEDVEASAAPHFTEATPAAELRPTPRVRDRSPTAAEVDGSAPLSTDRPAVTSLRSMAAASALLVVALGVAVAATAVRARSGSPASDSALPPSASASVMAEPPSAARPERVAPPSRAESSAPPSLAPRSITLHTQPEGAAVFAGSALLGHTPLDIPRPPTRERAELTLESAGFDARVVIVSWLSEPELTVPLTRRPRPRAAAHALPAPAAPQAPATAPVVPPRSHREFLDPWGESPLP